MIEMIEKKYGIRAEEDIDGRKIFKVFVDDDFHSYVFYDDTTRVWHSDDSNGGLLRPFFSFENAVSEALKWIEMLINKYKYEVETGECALLDTRKKLKRRMMQNLATWLIKDDEVIKPFHVLFDTIVNQIAKQLSITK